MKTSKGNFEFALNMIKAGKFAKREIIKNNTVIIAYKKRLYQMPQETGIRYPYVPTNADIFAEDWIEADLIIERIKGVIYYQDE